MTRLAPGGGLLAFANGVGLATAFAAGLLLLALARFEWAFNETLAPEGDVHQLYVSVDTPGQPRRAMAGTLADVAAALRAAEPGLKVARLSTPTGETDVRQGADTFPETVIEADPEIAQVLHLDAAAGDLARALAQPDGAAATRSAARRIWGRDDVLGASFSIEGRVYRVGAVLRDPARNSALADMDLLVSSRGAETALGRLDKAEDALSFSIGLARTFVKTGDPAALARAEAAADARVGNAIGRLGASGEAGAPAMRFTHHAVNLREPDAAEAIGMRPDPARADAALLAAVTGLAALVLAVATLNVVNLATTQAMRRAVTVAVRKAFGASSWRIARAFLAESALGACLAAAAGLALAFALEGWFGAFTGRALDMRADAATLAALGAAALVTGVLAGAYPAFVLARFRPAATLSARGAQPPGAGALRRVLVASQVATAVAAMAVALTIAGQLQHLTGSALGFAPDDVLIYRLPSPRAGDDSRLLALLSEMRRTPGVIVATTSEATPLEAQTTQTTLTTPAGVRASAEVVGAPPAFFTALGVTPLAGMALDAPEASLKTSAIVSLQAAHALGYAAARDAVGAQIRLGGETLAVVAVIPDIVMAGRRPGERAAFIYRARLDAARYVVVKLAPGAAGVAARLDAIHAGFFPASQPSRHFLADRIAARYADIDRLLGLVFFFGGLGVGAALLGVFGMAAASADRMRREASVRKAFGAPAVSICLLMISRIGAPVLVGAALGALAGYFVGRRWLEGFAARVETWGAPELVAVAAILALSLAVIAWRTLRLAMTRPAAALTYE